MSRFVYLASLCFVLIIAGCSSGSGSTQSPPVQPPAPPVSPPPAPQPQTWNFSFLPVQVVPMTNSRATASATVTESATGMRISVDARHVQNPTAVHVHQGIAGTNGPAVFELAQDPAQPDMWSADIVPTGQQRHSLYVDIHTTDFPDGEIRAQVPGGWPHSMFPLTPGDTVPAQVGPDLGTAAITMTDIIGWNWEPEISAHVWLDPSVVATSVSIDYAATGQNGPSIQSLERDPADPSHWFVEGMVLSQTTAGNFNFAGYYLSVATQARPGGAGRGQIVTRNYFFSESNEWFLVSSVDPWDGATVASLPVPLRITFTKGHDENTLDLATVQLLASGGDGRFQDGNETWIQPLNVPTTWGNSILAVFDSPALADDTYRVVVAGGNAGGLKSWDGDPLNGHYGNPGETSDFISAFTIDSNRPPPATLSEVQNSIFTPGCTLSGCHDANTRAGMLNLEQGSSYGQLVDVGSSDWDNWGYLVRVSPGNPDDSWLIRKFSEIQFGSHPTGNRRLSNTEYQMLRDWIADGAKDN